MIYHNFIKKETISRKNSGITLIALIISIILLILLAAISIRAAFNFGIIDFALKGVKDYNEEQEKENSALTEWDKMLKSMLIKSDDDTDDDSDKWDEILEKATDPHDDQELTDDIGIDANGEIINLDLWMYYPVESNQIGVGAYYESTGIGSRIYASK